MFISETASLALKPHFTEHKPHKCDKCAFVDEEKTQVEKNPADLGL